MTKKIVMTKSEANRSRKAVIKAIKYFGSGVKLAKTLNVRSQSVYSWKTDLANKSFSYIPLKYVLKIEKMTNKFVKKEDLRPDIYK